MITRIRELLDARQLSPTQFADLIGVGRPVMSHIMSERNKPSLEVVQKIIGAFPDISLPWLLAGTGPMLAAAATSPLPVAPPTPSASEAALAPVSAAPTAVVAAPTPAIAQPTAPFRSASASPPSTYPQPPKFRPAAAGSAAQVSAAALPTSQRRADAGSLAAPKSPEAPSILEPLPTPTVPLAAAGPGSDVSAPPIVAALPVAASALAVPTQTPAQSPAPVAAPPTASRNLGDLAAPTTEVAPPLTSLEAPDTATNPAAALSFLGEPGKAIRRIVIFYRDGSFSDFLPESS